MAGPRRPLHRYRRGVGGLEVSPGPPAQVREGAGRSAACAPRARAARPAKSKMNRSPGLDCAQANQLFVVVFYVS